MDQKSKQKGHVMPVILFHDLQLNKKPMVLKKTTGIFAAFMRYTKAPPATAFIIQVKHHHTVS